MKKIYEEPEFELKKFDFSEIMTNVDISDSEVIETGGFDNGDDIGG